MIADCDVVIIGAGLSGLSAAWELEKLGVSSFRVLEASSRVGGRTLNHGLRDGGYIEQGGAWVGPTQTALLALARELGVEIRSGKPEGDTYYGSRGIWSQIDHDGSQAADPAKRDYALAIEAFERLCHSVPTEAPWTTPDAAALDRTSIGEWIRQNTSTPAARLWLEGGIRKYQGGDPDSVSLLWMLHCIQSADYREMLDSAEDYLFVGGSQRLSLTIAERFGDRVVLETPVERIVDWDTDRARVVAGAASLRSRDIIVATTAATLRDVAFVPELPDTYQAIIAAAAPMSWVKFHACYDRPAWRGQIIGSQFLDLELRVETFDISPADERWGEIVGFLMPDSPGMVASDRQDFCMAFLVNTYGAAAANPREFVIHDWSKQPWIGGCVSTFPPGSVTAIGSALNAPVGRLHWATSERASVWANYMEGAVRSGQRAARAVAARLADRSGSEVTRT